MLRQGYAARIKLDVAFDVAEKSRCKKCAFDDASGQSRNPVLFQYREQPPLQISTRNNSSALR